MDGVSHERGTDSLAMFTVAIGTGLAITVTPLLLPVAAGIFTGGRYLTPDLDLKSRCTKNWGLLGFLWLPYQKAVPHRSIVSHSILLSTFIRSVYAIGVLGIVLLPLEAIATITVGFSVFSALIGLALAYPLVLGMFYLGLEISTWMHLLLDKIGSNRAKNKRRFR